MGMCMTYRRLSPTEFAQLMDAAKRFTTAPEPAPPLTSDVLGTGPITTLDVDAVKPAPPPPPLFFDPFAADYPRSPEEWIAEHAAGKVCRLEKDWHALHFLLTGDASLDPPCPVPPPLGNVVLGGTPTPIESGYGPDRYLNTDEVRAVADALNAITTEELKRRCDPAAFNAHEIYPCGRGEWDEDKLEGFLEDLLELYPEFVDFFRRAAEAGDLVLISRE